MQHLRHILPLLLAATTAMGTERVAIPQQDPAPSASPALVTEGYVDDARCAKCHPKIAREFGHLGMGRSFHVAGGEDAIADFSDEGGTFHHDASDLHYRMRLDDEGRMWMEQYELDEDGNPINAVDIEAHYSVGSGNHARTYLHQSASGELWELPVTWYTHDGWNMSPGFDAAEHQHFARQINRECMFCHNAYPAMEVGTDGRGDVERFPHALPTGIGCQRCHGPGALHVDLAYTDTATDEEIRESILNPTDLSPELADDVCLQCHMQPTSRLGSLVRPFDRGDFSYRPGEPLGDYLVHVDFELPDGHPTFEVNHHGYRLRESPCWDGPGSMGCLSCHDPHAKLTPTEIKDRTRTTCLGCHESMECNVETVMQIPHSEAQDCAGCHMPSRFSSDAIHIEVTDHLIQMPITDEERRGPTSDIPPPKTFTAHVHEPDRFDADDPLRNWEIIAEIIGNDSRRVDELATGIADRGDEATISEQLLLAQGYLDAGRDQEARRILETIDTTDPNNAMAQKNLATLEFDAGETDVARQRLDQLIEADPDDAAAHQLRAAILQQEGRIDEAIAALERSIALRGTDPAPLAQLGLLRASKGRFSDAIPALERAEALAPGNPSTAYNLGLAQWKDEQRAEAARTWNHALRRSPDAPRLLMAAGITRSLPWPDIENDPARGVELAKRLVQAQPASPDAMLLLAAATLAAGDHPASAEALNRATEMKADMGAIRLMQAMLIAELGNRDRGAELYQRVRPNITQVNMLRQGLLNRAEGIFDQP